MNNQEKDVILRVCDLSVKYAGKTALENVSFDVCRGDFLLVVGRNGTGKSTLVKAILDLVPKAFGKVEFTVPGMSKKIGYLPQQNEIQKDFPASCLEVVLSGFVAKKKFFSFYTKQEKRKALEVLEYLEIEKYAHRSFAKLSGGEKQRVLLARALVSSSFCDDCHHGETHCHCHDETFCHTNGLIVLDEPSNGLDPVANKLLYETLERLRREKGMTVIMVSHLVDSAKDYANKILHIDKSVAFFGKKEEYLDTELSKRFISTEELPKLNNGSCDKDTEKGGEENE